MSRATPLLENGSLVSQLGMAIRQAHNDNSAALEETIIKNENSRYIRNSKLFYDALHFKSDKHNLNIGLALVKSRNVDFSKQQNMIAFNNLVIYLEALKAYHSKIILWPQDLIWQFKIIYCESYDENNLEDLLDPNDARKFICNRIQQFSDSKYLFYIDFVGFMDGSSLTLKL